MNAISWHNNFKKIIELIVLLTHLSWITIYVVNNSKFLMHNIIVIIHSMFTLNTPDGSRTRIVSLPRDFKSLASASSATGA